VVGRERDPHDRDGPAADASARQPTANVMTRDQAAIDAAIVKLRELATDPNPDLEWLVHAPLAPALPMTKDATIAIVIARKHEDVKTRRKKGGPSGDESE
jgi:hypothetical protein